MQFEAGIHFTEIVCPTISDYLEAEGKLTIAVKKENDSELESAKFNALRLGAAAAIFLHHFSDVVANRPPENVPDFKGDVGKVRTWIATFGTGDVPILRDTADALKHSVLNPDRSRMVQHSGLVLTTHRGYGLGRFGEGKFGGVDEVWILSTSGMRPLTAVLKSVQHAWVKALGL
jgi:hypothetical protein